MIGTGWAVWRGTFPVVREFSVPPVATLSDSATLIDPVWDNAEQNPDTVQFARRSSGQGEWQDVTCAEFRDAVVALARGLVAAGIAAGDRVGLMSKTRYEWTLIDYAIWACGGVTVPIYETSSAEQVGWILGDSGAVACFVETDAHRAIVEGLLDRTPAVTRVWQIEGATPAVPELTAAGTAVEAAEIEQRRHAARADDLATIIYTSGTTGRPKGCMLSHRNMLSDIANAVPGLPNLFHPGASTLLFLPLAHSFARLVQIGVVQGLVRMGHTPDVRNLVPDLQGFRPTFVLAVPRVFEKVFNTAKQRAHADGKGAIFDRAERVAIAYSEALDGKGPGLLLRAEHVLLDRLVYRKLRGALGGHCHAAISGGAPLGARLAHFFRGIGVTVFEGYGLTETSPAIAVNLADHIRIGTVGRPLPGVTIRIADDDEILVKGDIVFRGYWNNPDATAATVTVDGWLKTGDAGYVDDAGFIYLHDRLKDMIVSGGENVSPAEVENVLMTHPGVGDVAVIGVPDERWGEAVKAIVVPTAGTTPSEAELIAYARERLAGFKLPKSVDFADALPRTPSGKLLKRTLREPYWEGVGRQIG